MAAIPNLLASLSTSAERSASAALGRLSRVLTSAIPVWKVEAILIAATATPAAATPIAAPASRPAFAMPRIARLTELNAPFVASRAPMTYSTSGLLTTYRLPPLAPSILARAFLPS